MWVVFVTISDVVSNLTTCEEEQKVCRSFIGMKFAFDLRVDSSLLSFGRSKF